LLREIIDKIKIWSKKFKVIIKFLLRIILKTPVPFNTNKKEEGVRFDLSESMFNYSRAKNRNEIKINSILFDPEKDFKITLFCSHLIHHRKAP